MRRCRTQYVNITSWALHKIILKNHSPSPIFKKNNNYSRFKLSSAQITVDVLGHTQLCLQILFSIYLHTYLYRPMVSPGQNTGFWTRSFYLYSCTTLKLQKQLSDCKINEYFTSFTREDAEGEGGVHTSLKNSFQTHQYRYRTRLYGALHLNRKKSKFIESKSGGGGNPEQFLNCFFFSISLYYCLPVG